MKKIEKMKKKKPRNENPQPGSTKNRPKTRVKVKPKELYGKRYTPNLTENKLLKHIVPIVPNPKLPKDKKEPVFKNPKFKLPKDGKPTVMIPANRSKSTKSTEVRKRLKPLKGSPYYQRWKKK